jgi:hypothetical protein
LILIGIEIVEVQGSGIFQTVQVANVWALSSYMTRRFHGSAGFRLRTAFHRETSCCWSLIFFSCRLLAGISDFLSRSLSLWREPQEDV